MSGDAPGPSTTAEYMALFRALESRRSGRLFDDPLAAAFLSPSLRWVVRAAAVPLVGDAVAALIDGRWPGARTSGIARTRFIDDVVHGVGVRQILLADPSGNPVELFEPAAGYHERERSSR